MRARTPHHKKKKVFRAPQHTQSPHHHHHHPSPLRQRCTDLVWLLLVLPGSQVPASCVCRDRGVVTHVKPALCTRAQSGVALKNEWPVVSLCLGFFFLDSQEPENTRVLPVKSRDFHSRPAGLRWSKLITRLLHATGGGQAGAAQHPACLLPPFCAPQRHIRGLPSLLETVRSCSFINAPCSCYCRRLV